MIQPPPPVLDSSAMALIAVGSSVALLVAFACLVTRGRPLARTALFFQKEMAKLRGETLAATETELELAIQRTEDDEVTEADVERMLQGIIGAEGDGEGELKDDDSSSTSSDEEGRPLSTKDRLGDATVDADDNGNEEEVEVRKIRRELRLLRLRMKRTARSGDAFALEEEQNAAGREAELAAYVAAAEERARLKLLVRLQHEAAVDPNASDESGSDTGGAGLETSGDSADDSGGSGSDSDDADEVKLVRRQGRNGKLAASAAISSEPASSSDNWVEVEESPRDRRTPVKLASILEEEEDEEEESDGDEQSRASKNLSRSMEVISRIEEESIIEPGAPGPQHIEPLKVYPVAVRSEELSSMGTTVETVISQNSPLEVPPSGGGLTNLKKGTSSGSGISSASEAVEEDDEEVRQEARHKAMLERLRRRKSDTAVFAPTSSEPHNYSTSSKRHPTPNVSSPVEHFVRTGPSVSPEKEGPAGPSASLEESKFRGTPLRHGERRSPLPIPDSPPVQDGISATNVSPSLEARAPSKSFHGDAAAVAGRHSENVGYKQDLPLSGRGRGRGVGSRAGEGRGPRRATSPPRPLARPSSPPQSLMPKEGPRQLSAVSRSSGAGKAHALRHSCCTEI